MNAFFESRQNRRNLTAVIVLIICISFVAIPAAGFLIDRYHHYQTVIAENPRALEPPPIGQSLIFPDGWEPVTCATTGGSHAGSDCRKFVCRTPGGVGGWSYKYCIPTTSP